MDPNSADPREATGIARQFVVSGRAASVMNMQDKDADGEGVLHASIHGSWLMAHRRKRHHVKNRCGLSPTVALRCTALHKGVGGEENTGRTVVKPSLDDVLRAPTS